MKKNIKSKIVVPALGLILLSTAASISGSVAWFTANRTATVKAGEFAVVKTGDDLAVDLTAGIGTTEDDVNHEISNVTGTQPNTHTNLLTDASFDHVAIANNKVGTIISPDSAGSTVGSKPTLNGLTAAQVERGTDTYSVLTWDMTFSITFSASATANQGLYLDTTNADTYMHLKTKPANNTNVADGTYFTDKACTVAATGTADGSTYYYKTAPVASGKAFRIAFVPTAISGHSGSNKSFALAKVWAANEGTTTSGGLTERQFVSSSLGVGTALAGTSYSTVGTVSFDGTDYANAENTTGKALITGNTDAVPNDNAVDASGALAKNNYLGYFTADPGQTINITYTCVAWYEGTNPFIVNNTAAFEIIVASMKFGVASIQAA